MLWTAPDGPNDAPQTEFKLVDAGLFLFAKTVRIDARAIYNGDGESDLSRNADRFSAPQKHGERF